MDDQQGLAVAQLADVVLGLVKKPDHVRVKIGVEQGHVGPGGFIGGGAHLVGEQQRHRAQVMPGIIVIGDFPDLELVGGVEVGVVKADHNHPGPAAQEAANGQPHLLPVDVVFACLLIDAGDHTGGDNQVQRRTPGGGSIEAFFKSPGDNQSQAGADPLDEGVGGVGRGKPDDLRIMEQLRQGKPELGGAFLDALEETDRQVMRRGVHLDPFDSPIAGKKAIGKSPAIVDINRKSHFGPSCKLLINELLITFIELSPGRCQINCIIP